MPIIIWSVLVKPVRTQCSEKKFKSQILEHKLVFGKEQFPVPKGEEDTRHADC